VAKKSEPFTLDHFLTWSRKLVLDTGKRWRLERYQQEFVADLFAADPPAEAWLVVPEGNGKSTLIAGLALYHLQYQADASVAVAASTRDQSGIIYRQACGFLNRSELPGFHQYPGYRRIVYGAKREVGPTLQIYAADAGAGDGIIPTFCLLDELHRHKTLDLYRTWGGKMEKRGGKMAVISTAGEPGSEFEEAREDIRRSSETLDRRGSQVIAVAAGIVLHEWSVPEDGDVEDMEVVSAANPLSTITATSLARKRSKPTMTLSHWRRLTCNLPTRADSAAISEHEWFGAEVDDRIPSGLPIAAGLDVGWKYDTTALVPLWMRDAEFRLLGQATILEPPQDGGFLDPAKIERAIMELHSRNPLALVVMDMTRAEQLADWIEKATGATVVDRTQSNPMAALDYERFTDALRLGWLRHVGDVGLTRHVLNAIARALPGGDIRFDRPSESRTGKGEQRRRVIDALVAAAMVHTTAAEEFCKPAYRTAGF